MGNSGPKEKNKKETILDGCFKLLLQKREGNITVTDLERIMGVTRGKIFYYYKDMDEIIRSTIEYYFQKVIDYFSFFYNEDKTTLWKFLFDYVENWKRFDQSIVEVTGDGASSVINFFLHASASHPDFEEKIKSLFDRELKCWESVLGKAIESGEIRANVDVPVAATKFHCLHMGVMVQSYFVPYSFKANTLQMLFISLYEDIKKPSEISSEKKNIFG